MWADQDKEKKVKQMKNRVRQLRNAAGISGTAVAGELGLPVATYYKKETGSIRWTLPEAKRVADYFHKTIEEVFFASE